VFQNLIGNAVKFRGEAPPTVTISSTRFGQYHDVTVADNGIGIEPQYSDQIFEIFKRLHTHAAYEGTGIGLALAKKVVEFHGGSLTLDDKPPPGALFHVMLPVGAPAHQVLVLPDLEPRRQPVTSGG
jgi:signal transduction histidine kinase